MMLYKLLRFSSERVTLFNIHFLNKTTMEHSFFLPLLPTIKIAELKKGVETEQGGKEKQTYTRT